jgi:tetratricopeptide (TPR) repeat protein
MIENKDREKIESLAKKHIKRGKINDAIAEYRKLLSGDEQDISIRAIIGDLFAKSGQKDKAVEEFHRIADFYEEKGLFSKAIAILKKANRLDPDNIKFAGKLADLYQDQGFASEAKSEYLKFAESLKKENKTKEAIQIYRKLLDMIPQDMDIRIDLAELYKKEGQIEQATTELNNVAEHKIKKDDLEAAQKILSDAWKLNEDNPRTLINMIEIFKQNNKKKEALELINKILKKDEGNIEALNLLGNLYLDEKKYKEAEEVYSRIISLKPNEVEATINLGRIFIQKGKLDEAYEVYEPLVDTLIRKGKEDKAVGLLGLILAGKKAHIPSLEKLASLFRNKAQKENLEIVNQVILEEYKKLDLKEKMLTVLRELVDTFPEDEGYYHEYIKLRKGFGEGDDASSEEKADLSISEVKELVNATLAKVDLYLEQGLIRNAKRILEDLRLRFPNETNINEKIEEIKELSSKIRRDEIAERIGRVSQKESQIVDKIPDTSKVGEVQEDKITSADVFAETDIIPMGSYESGEREYFDLSTIIDEEAEAINSIINYQIRGDTTIVEKALSDIVSDFRNALEEKVDKENYESHYNLGIAFLEQELFDEAIEECKLSARSKELEVDSYSVISFCYNKKKDFKEALDWIEKAMKLAEKDSSQSLALKYEQGSLYEAMNKGQKALKAFQEVKKLNAEYRDVKIKIKALEKQ